MSASDEYTFIATSRWAKGSFARYTTLEAPRPSSRPMTYLPSCLGILTVMARLKPGPHVGDVSSLRRPRSAGCLSQNEMILRTGPEKRQHMGREGASGMACGTLHHAGEPLGRYRSGLLDRRFDAEDFLVGCVEIGLAQQGEGRGGTIQQHVGGAGAVVHLGEIGPGDELAGREIFETEARFHAGAGFLVGCAHEEHLLGLARVGADIGPGQGDAACRLVHHP